MDYGKFTADFIAANIESIIKIGVDAFGNLDEKTRVLLKTAYLGYLKSTQAKYSKSKSFFIRDQATDLYNYYEPTSIRCDNTTIVTPGFKECLKQSSRIVLLGTGGSGKSVLIKHLFLDCIRNKTYAPILIELRDLNLDGITLDEAISQTLEMHHFNVSGDYINRAKRKGHFSFFLDGFDEVDYSLRNNLVQEIKKMSSKYPDCPIFLSSRADDIFNGIDEFSIFRMLPLDLKSALNLVAKLPFDDEIKGKFSNDLDDGLFIKHETFLSNPLLLSIMLITYGENAEIPSKLSLFYNQAYEALFQRHDANKGGYTRKRRTDLDIQDFAKVFSIFAIQTYHHRKFKMSRTACLGYLGRARDATGFSFEPEDYLDDLLKAACLLIEDGLEIAFSHRSFQEYFVALHISVASPEAQEKFIDLFFGHNPNDSVILLLYEINPDLVERVFFLPRLAKFFDDIGVRKKVGITHTFAYLNKTFKKITVPGLSESSHGFEWAFHSSPIPDYWSVIHLLVNLSGLSLESREHYFEHLRNKYAEEGPVEFLIKNLTYKTPIIVDVANSDTMFGTGFLQMIFDEYKRLDKKNSMTIKTIDDLLELT
jgi:hypothetical protein